LLASIAIARFLRSVSQSNYFNDFASSVRLSAIKVAQELADAVFDLIAYVPKHFSLLLR
jgi:hypothetical protein